MDSVEKKKSVKTCKKNSIPRLTRLSKLLSLFFSTALQINIHISLYAIFTIARSVAFGKLSHRFSIDFSSALSNQFSQYFAKYTFDIQHLSKFLFFNARTIFYIYYLRTFNHSRSNFSYLNLIKILLLVCSIVSFLFFRRFAELFLNKIQDKIPNSQRLLLSFSTGRESIPPRHIYLCNNDKKQYHRCSRFLVFCWNDYSSTDPT